MNKAFVLKQLTSEITIEVWGGLPANVARASRLRVRAPSRCHDLVQPDVRRRDAADTRSQDGGATSNAEHYRA